MSLKQQQDAVHDPHDEVRWLGQFAYCLVTFTDSVSDLDRHNGVASGLNTRSLRN